MPLFHQSNRTRTPESPQVYAAFEVVHTIVDLLAALSFLAGSILFFWPATERLAIWLFVVGSVFFTVKPMLRFARELRLAAMGDASDLAQRYERP